MEVSTERRKIRARSSKVFTKIPVSRNAIDITKDLIFDLDIYEPVRSPYVFFTLDQICITNLAGLFFFFFLVFYNFL